MGGITWSTHLSFGVFTSPSVNHPHSCPSCSLNPDLAPCPHIQEQILQGHSKPTRNASVFETVLVVLWTDSCFYKRDTAVTSCSQPLLHSSWFHECWQEQQVHVLPSGVSISLHCASRNQEGVGHTVLVPEMPSRT